MLEFAGAEVEDVQDQRELDVLEDFGVDRVPLLELEPDHLDGHVTGQTTHSHLLHVDSVTTKSFRMLSH